MIEKTHIFLIFLTIFNSFQILILKNPIYLVLFLILIFFNTSITLFLFNIDFLGLVIIIIYVGAIAILFLFIIMMLDIKLYELQTNIFALFFIFSLFFLSIHFFFNSFFLNYEFKQIKAVFQLIDPVLNIKLLGQILFNYFLICLLVAGFALLTSVLGPISLTLTFSNNVFFNINRTLSRSSKILSIFI